MSMMFSTMTKAATLPTGDTPDKKLDIISADRAHLTKIGVIRAAQIDKDYVEAYGEDWELIYQLSSGL